MTSNGVIAARDTSHETDRDVMISYKVTHSCHDEIEFLTSTTAMKPPSSNCSGLGGKEKSSNLEKRCLRGDVANGVLFVRYLIILSPFVKNLLLLFC